MPLYKPSEPKTTEPIITETAAISSVEKDVVQATTFLEGYPVVGTWYSQVLGQYDSLKPLDTAINPVLQQYHRIDNFEILGESGISFDYIRNQNTSTLQLSAFVKPNTVIPQENDLFVMDAGQSTRTILLVTDVRKLSQFDNAAWAFTLIRFDEMTQVYADNLVSKTVKVSYYDSDRVYTGTSSVVADEYHGHIKKLLHWRSRLVNDIDLSATHEHGLYPLDGVTDLLIYDHHFITAIRRAVDYTELRRFSQAMTYDYLPNRIDLITIWDSMLVSANGTTMYPIDQLDEGKVLVPITKAMIVGHGSTHLIRYSDYTHVMDTVILGPGAILSEYTTESPEGGEGRPLFKPVVSDDHYVFSEALYDAVLDDMSMLELCVHNHCNGVPTDPEGLITLCEGYDALSDLDQFYYRLPLVILIDQALMRNFNE